MWCILLVNLYLRVPSIGLLTWDHFIYYTMFIIFLFNLPYIPIDPNVKQLQIFHQFQQLPIWVLMREQRQINTPIVKQSQGKQAKPKINSYKQIKRIKIDKGSKAMSQESAIEIKFSIGDTKVTYKIDRNWSINKTKCLLSSQFEKLKFNEFQLMHCGKLLNGYLKVRDIVDMKLQSLSLVIVNVKSKVLFEEYYTKMMTNYIGLSRFQKQPIMDKNYQMMTKSIDYQLNQQKNKMLPNNLNINEGQNNQNFRIMQEPRVFDHLRTIGLCGFFIMLISKGGLYQIVFMTAIIIMHFLIQLYRKRYGKNNQNANNQTQQIQVNREGIDGQGVKAIDYIKSQIMMRLYKLVQVVFCFILTFYPNWDITLHYNINNGIIKEWRNNINRLRPGTYDNNLKTN